MRMLVLGAGLQGSACAYDLLQNPGVEAVIVGDVDVASLPRYLEALRGDPRLELVALDARDDDAVRDAMRRADACMNALPYYFNVEMATLAVETGIHYADLGGNTELVFKQLELDDAAQAHGISVIPDCGLAPGMVNILAAAGVRELDETEVVRIYVGGLPQDPEPPLNYQIVYSLEGVLDYYTTRAWIVRDGQRQQVDALTELEPVEFPEPAGTLEAFQTGGGSSTLPWTYEGKLRTLEYKTLRYPGHATIVRAMRDLGLLDLEPVQAGDQQVVPRDVFIACTAPKLHQAESHDLVAVRVLVDGTKDGARRQIEYDLLDFYDESTGISAMERATGFSLSITGQMQVNRRITRTGVCTPDECVPAEGYIHELARRDIQVQRHVC